MVGGQRHALAALPPGKRAGTHCIGGWVIPRAGLDGYVKSLPPPGFDPWTVQLSESLYQLRYPGPQINILISGKLRYPAIPFSRRCRII